MSLTKEELKKLVLEEVVKQELQNEGAITNWLKGQASKGLRAVGSAANKGADALKPEDPSALTPEKKMSLVADFIQINRDNKLVRSSDLYNKLLSQETSLQEVYESDFLKLMKQKKVTDTDIDKFIQQMSAFPGLRKQLEDLKLPIAQQSITKPGQTKPTQDSSKAVEVKTKKANIKFLPPVENVAPQQAQKAAQINADRFVELEKLFRSGKATTEQKDEFIALFAAQEEKLQEVIVQEIYNVLTGK